MIFPLTFLCTVRSVRDRPFSAKMSGLIPKHTVMQQALACVAYGGVSISITLFNKAVFSIYDFKFPNLVMLGQMVVTLALVKAASSYEVVEVSRISRAGLRKVGVPNLGKGLKPKAVVVVVVVDLGQS